MKLTYFKCSVLISATIGEILTTLSLSNLRIQCEPYVEDCTDGIQQVTMTYNNLGSSVAQDISRHFIKNENYYLLVEKAGPSVKNIFKLEDKSRNASIYTLVTHFGSTSDNNDPLTGSNEILTSLKQISEMTTYHCSDIGHLSSDNFDSDSDEEDEESKLYQSMI